MAATRYRWFVVFLLFAVTVANYVDRSAIAYAIPAIKRELGLSPGDVGTILGAFGLGYAVTTLFGGFAVDRYGARLVLTVAVALWSLSIGATALASGVMSFYLARTLLGVAEGPNFPAMSGAINVWLAPRERATALGGALVAVPIALAIGGPIASTLLVWFGWRGAFVALFLLSIAWVPLWWLCFRDDPAKSGRVDAAELARIKGEGPSRPSRHGPLRLADIGALLRNPTLLANDWAFFVFGYFLFFFMSWLPSYLVEAYGLDIKAVGLFTVLPWAAAAVALIAVGRLSDYLLQATGRLRVARSYIIVATQLVTALAVVPVAFTHDLGVAIGAITVAVAASMGGNAAYAATNLDVTPGRAASAFGIMEFAFALAGFAAPAITGWVLGLRGSFEDCFLLMAALALSSVAVVLLFHHPDRDRA
ncbi:MFS transporter [Segnochrobactrum spirostomi]|uniref:MFS transporter n=1 Tax=Segnochrobactrum spirostomi TaxID=2608987 RepID=A0A6A7XYV4_9HYPH|nr:MFS transporter [Segnochrobactrum spirostomi]MQT11673.1 MFS transporter [Segnochrobactrum spirostomi]